MAEQKKSSILQFAARFEKIVLCLLLTAMIVLACLQIVLRSFFSSGLPWAEPALRFLVLWSGLLGAAMATSRGKHIALDLAGYLIPWRLQPLMQLICYAFSSITAAFLTWASILFIRNEMEFGSPGLFDLPSWGWNLIFPLAFALITVRFLALFVTTLIRILRRQSNLPPVRQ